MFRRKNLILIIVLILFLFGCNVKKNKPNETPTNPNNAETNSSPNEGNRPETEESTSNTGTITPPDSLNDNYPLNSKIRVTKSSDSAKDIVLMDRKKYDGFSDKIGSLVDIHDYDESKIHFAIVKSGSGNFTQFETLFIGTLDLETDKFVKIKEVDDQSRIADFTIINDKIIYTLVPKTPEVVHSDFIPYTVIEEDADGTISVIDQAQVAFHMDIPFFTIYNNKVYYPKTNVEYFTKVNRQEDDLDVVYKFEVIEYDPQTKERKVLDYSEGTYFFRYQGFLSDIFLFNNRFIKRDNDIYLKWNSKHKTKISTIDTSGYHSKELDYLSIKFGQLKDKYLLANFDRDTEEKKIIILDKETLTEIDSKNYSSKKIKEFARFFSNDEFAVFHLNDDQTSFRYCEDLTGEFTDIKIYDVNPVGWAMFTSTKEGFNAYYTGDNFIEVFKFKVIK